MKAIWKGAITFGLVNIPVNVYVASKEKELKFIMLHKKDMSEIRYARICKLEEMEIPWDEIVKGYEYQKGDFVILTEKDFEAVSLKKNKNIEIMQFVDPEEIDTMYYAKPYFLEPGKNAEQAYCLLREALSKSKKVGLAKSIWHNREHLAVVRAHGDLLLLEELHYESEIIKATDLEIPKVKVNSKELEMALELIEQRLKPFKPQEYKESYTEELKALIKEKAAGRKVHPKTTEEKPSKIVDLMSLLKASIVEGKKKPAKKRQSA